MRKIILVGVVVAGAIGGLIPMAAWADAFGGGANAFSIDFVNVGNPGNADDGGAGIYSSPYGGVNYTFRMGTYEVSREMITKANAAGNLAIGLENLAAAGGNRPAQPATGVSWNEAARFVNWLNDQVGSSHAYKFTLQPGEAGYDSNADLTLWSPGDAGYDPNNLFRNSNARYFLPNEDEWYKAAYYSGSGNVYYDFATQQDSPNGPASVASGTANGTAVYNRSYPEGPADITLAGGLSHYGTMAQTGNVWEWMENNKDGTNNTLSAYRLLRGSYWYEEEVELPSVRVTDDEFGNLNLGFRVASIASVPEPGTGTLALLGFCGAFTARWRRR